MPDEKNILATRKHIVLAARESQLRINAQAVEGGAPYINDRLSRLPYESDVSWGGSKLLQHRIGLSLSNFSAEGRKDRAYLINRAARICNKINQYVFSSPIKRENIADDFKKDTDREGNSINQFMQMASTDLTSLRWCWVQIDRRGLLTSARPRSLLEKERNKDRVFWSLWKPYEVVDWSFDLAGELLWLITEHYSYENADPLSQAKNQRIRTLWERGRGKRIFFKTDEKEQDKIERIESFTFPAEIVPFVHIGKISANPFWFDDVERIQASLLNLESVNNENLFQTVYPQLVLPADIIETIKNAAQCSGERALELVRGLNYPILESQESNGLTRYITPETTDLEAISREIDRRKRELFETVGLALHNTDRAQVESAEAKAWDNLDPECLLAERAQQLEEAERKCVAISRQFDSEFSDYQPVYSRKFDISDLKTDIEAIIAVGNLSLPEEGFKEVQRAGVEILDKVVPIIPERKQKILDAIENGEISDEIV